MDVLEAIEKRRTIRIYRKPATEEQLRRIILAGTKAPSGGNRQPWEFILIDDPAIVDQLAAIKYKLNRRIPPNPGEGQEQVEQRSLNQKHWFRNASVVAVCHPMGPAAWGLSVSAWLCMENMSLAALAEGLGSVIVTYWDQEKEEVEKLLGLPEGYELAAVMRFGEPAEEGSPREKNPFRARRPDYSWLHRNQF